MSKVRNLETTSWGVGNTLSRDGLSNKAFNDLLDVLTSTETLPEVLARMVIHGELYPRNKVPQRGMDVSRLERALATVNSDRGAWPNFVSDVLRHVDLAAVRVFIKKFQLKDDGIRPADIAAWSRAEPLELAVLRGLRGQKDDPAPQHFRLKTPRKKNAFLTELLGAKTAQSVRDQANANHGDSAGPEPPKLDIPIPNAGRSRRLSRRTAANAMGSVPAFSGNGLTRLGRANPLTWAIRRPTSISPISPNVRTAGGTWKAIQAQNRRKSINVMDTAELPPAPDTLTARVARLNEKARLKEEKLMKRKSAEEAKRARKEKMRKQDIERKRKITQEYRKRQAQLESSVYYNGDEEDENLPPASDADSDSRISNGRSPPGEISSAQPFKRQRVPRKNTNPGAALTGEEAYRARARFSNKPSLHINAIERSLRGPQYRSMANGEMSTSRTSSPIIATPQPPAVAPLPSSPGPVTVAPDLISTRSDSDLPIEFLRAVGEYRSNLTEADQVDLLKFTTKAPDMNSIFPGNEDRKEYVVFEDDQCTIVIRCIRSERNWHRVRYRYD